MFDEMLIRAKEEVRDLKTAHPRGLGMLNFATASATASGTSPSYYTYDIVVTFASSGVFPPFLELSADQTKGGFFRGSWDASNLTFSVEYEGSDYSDPAPTIKAVASVPIVSLTVTPRT